MPAAIAGFVAAGCKGLDERYDENSVGYLKSTHEDLQPHADCAEEHACDREAFALARALNAGELIETDSAEDQGQEGRDCEAKRGGDKTKESQYQGGDGKAIAFAAVFDGGSLHGEGHSASGAVVGGHGVGSRAAGADDVGLSFV